MVLFRDPKRTEWESYKINLKETLGDLTHNLCSMLTRVSS